MADTPTFSADALVRKVLADEHADPVREAVAPSASGSWGPR
jgi:hypothetical protein